MPCSSIELSPVYSPILVLHTFSHGFHDGYIFRAKVPTMRILKLVKLLMGALVPADIGGLRIPAGSSECSDLDPVFSDEELSRMSNDIATNSTLEAVETALDYHLNRAQCRRKKAKQEVGGENHARPGGRKGKRAKPDVGSGKHSEADVGSKRLAKTETGCGMFVNQMVGNWKQLTPEVGNGKLEKIEINAIRSNMKATRNCKVNRSSLSCQQSFHDTSENSSEINCLMSPTDSDTCIKRNIESDNGVRNGSSRSLNLGECTRRRRNGYSKNTIDADVDSTSINNAMSDICDWNDKDKNDKMIDSDNDSVCSVERRDNWKKLNHDGSRSKVGSGSANVSDNGSKFLKMREHVRRENLQDSPIKPNLAILDRLEDRDRSTSLAMVDRLEDRDRSKLPFAEEPAFRGGDFAHTERRDSSSAFEKILYDASQPALLSPIQSLTDLTNSRQAYVSTASMVTYESLSTEQASCRQKPGKRKYTR